MDSKGTPAPEQTPEQKIQSHRELIVWQKSMKLAVEIYRLGSRLPSKEAYGLIGQMTRSAASVPANIAEGHARGTPRDYSHFLSIAKGSLSETETFVLLAVELGYVSQTEAARALSLMTEIGKMLTVLRKRLGNRF